MAKLKEFYIDHDIDDRIDVSQHKLYNHFMSEVKIKRITANLPADLLASASEVTNKGITETIIYGLELVKRTSAGKRAMSLKGKIDIDVDLDISRERTTR